MMMLITEQLAKYTDTLHQQNKSIVLVGGCFDMIHIGHVKFLTKAQTYGDILMVLLESDKNVRHLKGMNRPLFPQSERAQVLEALKCVSSIVLLPPDMDDKKYRNIIQLIKPQIIAVTEHDPLLGKKKAHADAVNAAVAVIPHIDTFSTSKLASVLGIE